MKVICIVGKGFEEGEALMPVALLRRAEIITDIASLDGNENTGKHNISINQLININDVNPDDYDMLMLPGGPHWKQLEADERVKNLIFDFDSKNKYISAICAAPTILGRLGLLKGKNYTCFTAMNEDFGGNYIDKYTVKDGKLITGRSVAASIDFALEIIGELLGEEKLATVKERIYY